MTLLLISVRNRTASFVYETFVWVMEILITASYCFDRLHLSKFHSEINWDYRTSYVAEKKLCSNCVLLTVSPIY